MQFAQITSSTLYTDNTDAQNASRPQSTVSDVDVDKKITQNENQNFTRDTNVLNAVIYFTGTRYSSYTVPDKMWVKYVRGVNAVKTG
jgi:hypothetical protein